MSLLNILERCIGDKNWEAAIATGKDLLQDTAFSEDIHIRKYIKLYVALAYLELDMLSRCQLWVDYLSYDLRIFYDYPEGADPTKPRLDNTFEAYLALFISKYWYALGHEFNAKENIKLAAKTKHYESGMDGWYRTQVDELTDLINNSNIAELTYTLNEVFYKS